MQVQNPLGVITPTLDANVLAILALAPDVGFTTGQMRRLVPPSVDGLPRSVPGIRKVLERLAEQGVVDVEHVGRVAQYRLNNDHLAADHIKALAQMRSRLLERMQEELESWTPKPVYAALFGSAARGQMRPDSDIDVLIVVPDDGDESVWASRTEVFAAQVKRWTGNDTRPLVWGEAEVVARAWEPVLRDIAEEGKTICGSTTWLRRVVRKAAGASR